jgi:hypothetical protein
MATVIMAAIFGPTLRFVEDIQLFFHAYFQFVLILTHISSPLAVILHRLHH